MLDERSLASLQWSAGSALPAATFPELTRTMLALYAGGSGDHNPLHIDSDFARSSAKMDDVIGHGMLTMALMARYVTAVAGAGSLRKYSMRFVGMSKVGDRIVCSGTVTRVFDDGARCAEVELRAVRQGGELLAAAAATFAIAGAAGVCIAVGVPPCL